MSTARELCSRLARRITPMIAWLITGVRGRWVGCKPEPRQRVYFANHSSHGDFILIWSALPDALRRQTRPVAGADYWNKPGLRTFIGTNVFNALLIDRQSTPGSPSPLEQMEKSISDGESLIIFPEGTRNTTDDVLPFKSGIFYLSSACPNVDFVPVWIENINRVLPKGDFLPVPLLCSVAFGAPVNVSGDETKAAFLKRARCALLDLSPGKEVDA